MRDLHPLRNHTTSFGELHNEGFQGLQTEGVDLAAERHQAAFCNHFIRTTESIKKPLLLPTGVSLSRNLESFQFTS